MKLFARDIPLIPSVPRRADPLAGPDFTGGVVIVLRQMLVEIILGIRQIFMRYGTKHKTDFSWFSKGFVSFCEQSVFSFWPSIRPPNGNPAKRETGKDYQDTQNAFWISASSERMEASGKCLKNFHRSLLAEIPKRILFHFETFAGLPSGRISIWWPD